ncbi:hypothetical protein Pla52n_48980 [Stieleria varia]|uniref:Uncharacterized protein n=1 Tax=Stieleria varia TaxID=2528005 RepID=A0A5C6AGS1_9BACT|nr:hypothetical protein Pla52n_48980 [Stieleria varia]
MKCTGERESCITVCLRLSPVPREFCCYAIEELTLLGWLRRIFATVCCESDVEWEFGSYPDDTVGQLLSNARAVGDDLKRSRTVHHQLTFPTIDLASSFRDRVPISWSTNVKQRVNGDGWICECTRDMTPQRRTLAEHSRLLWGIALSVHPTLWAYLGMSDCSGENFWYVAPPMLSHESVA